jgi:hypothetical protein
MSSESKGPERTGRESTSLPQIGADQPPEGACEGCEGGGRRGFLFAAGSTLLAVGGGLAAVPIVTVVIDPS